MSVSSAKLNFTYVLEQQQQKVLDWRVISFLRQTRKKRVCKSWDLNPGPHALSASLFYSVFSRNNSGSNLMMANSLQILFFKNLPAPFMASVIDTQLWV